MFTSSTSFPFDIEKSIEVVHYVLNKTGNTDFHKLFKILYFAEQKHLATYGHPITGDDYIAMKNGPVPSHIYDVLKGARTKWNQEFDVVRYYVESGRMADVAALAESEIEMLALSIEENISLSFEELTHKSHDAAWDKAVHEMSPIDIAESGGANNEMLRYIETNMQHSTAF